jgi:hypothetical protein
MARAKFLTLFAASVFFTLIVIVLSQASDYQNWDPIPVYEAPVLPDTADITPQTVIPPVLPASDPSQVFYYAHPNIINSPVISDSIYSSGGINNPSGQYIGPALPPASILDKLEEEERLRRAGEITYPELSVIQDSPADPGLD